MPTLPHPVICSVSHNGRHPILFLPRGKNAPSLKAEPIEVTANGMPHTAWVARIAINVVSPAGEGKRNVLPDLLRGWFGAGAGGGSNAGRSSKFPTNRYRSSSTDEMTRSVFRLRSHHSLPPMPWPSV